MPKIFIFLKTLSFYDFWHDPFGKLCQGVRISHFANLTLRKFHTVQRNGTITSLLANVEFAYGQFRLFWGVLNLCSNFTILYSFCFRLICEELVRFLSDVKNWYSNFTNINNRYQFLTHVKNCYSIFINV